MRARGDALAAVASALALASCAVGPNYVEPEPPIPDAWHLKLTRGLAEGQASLQTWWTTLADQQLNDLIERAYVGNLDLAIAIDRMDEARARRGIARGDWFPDADAGASFQRVRTSGDFPPLPLNGNQTTSIWSAGLDASWELDFFGRIRRSVEAADAGLMASVENYRDVLVVLYADVATSYVSVRTLQERIRYARSNVELQRQTMQLTVDRNKAGLAPVLDVRQAELNLATTEAFIPTLEAARVRTINRLGVLLGMTPGVLHQELAWEAPIPLPPPAIPVALPFELLRQRPDIRRAERELASQSAQIGVATADLYPRFALLGTFAFDATDLTSLFTGDTRSFGFGPAFRWNLFDGGRVRSNIQAEEALARQAESVYQNTVLAAYEEVESSMVDYEQEYERRDALERSVVAARASVELVTTLYRTGLTDFQNVLDTQRALFTQQDALANSNGTVTLNLIRIYKALGGGWTPPADDGDPATQEEEAMDGERAVPEEDA